MIAISESVFIAAQTLYFKQKEPGPQCPRVTYVERSTTKIEKKAKSVFAVPPSQPTLNDVGVRRQSSKAL